MTHNLQDLKIRIATKEDAPRLLAIYAPYVTDTAITFEYEVPSLSDFENRICTTLQKYPYLVAEKEGEIIGYAYAGPFHERKAYDWSVEMSIYVDRTHRKSGAGRALYEALEKALSAQHILNLYACIAYVDHEDPYLDQNSVQFHEHMGYHLAGTFHQCGYKFGRWYDMVWLEKIIGDHAQKEADMIPFSALRKQ